MDDLIERLRRIARDEHTASWRKPHITEAADRIEALEAALTPSGDTKAEYMGEFSFNITDSFYDEDAGEFTTQQRKVYVPWTTIKEIMAAIHERASLRARKEREG